MKKIKILILFFALIFLSIFIFLFKQFIIILITANSIGLTYFTYNPNVTKVLFKDKNAMKIIKQVSTNFEDYLLNERRNKNVSYNGSFDPKLESRVDSNLINDFEARNLNLKDNFKTQYSKSNINAKNTHFLKSGGSNNNRYDSINEKIIFEPKLYKILKTHPSYFNTLNDPLNVECTPIFNNGNLYYATAYNTFVCFNIDENKIKFELKFTEYPARRGFLLSNSNDILSNQRIYLQVASYIISINPSTGKLDKNFGNKGFVNIGYGTSPPVIYDNILLVGTNIPGRIYALNAKNGNLIWKKNLSLDFANTPLGGPSPWSGYLVDFKRKSLIVTTGNPKPPLFGGKRRGKNLFSNCILSFDIQSGKLNWYKQEVIHDLWDYDIPSAPSFTTILYKNKMLDVVVVPTKIGNLLMLDRETGKFIFDAEYRDVPKSDVPGEITSNKQLFINKPEKFINIEFHNSDFRTNLSEATKKKISNQNLIFGEFQPPSLKSTLVTFGLHGGAEWPGMAINPKTNTAFIPINNFPWKLRLYLQDNSAKPLNNKKNEGLIYTNYCKNCHGEKRNGLYQIKGEVETNYMPSLVGLLYTDRLKYFNNIVTINKIHDKPVIKNLKDLEMLKRYLLKVDSLSINNKSIYLESAWTQFLDDKDLPVSKQAWGEIVSYNLELGKILWRKTFGDYGIYKNKQSGQPNYGGVCLTSNGILFATGTPDQKVRAFNSNNGNEIWNFNLSAAGSAPPYTFTYKGKNYLIINATGGQFYQFKNKSSDLYIFNF
jgi:quinoprotein glucose dehydrogenase